MASSVEVRVPFLDHKLVETVLSFPIEILQYTTTDGTIHHKGLIRICLTKECTSVIGPGALFAEILLTETETGGAEDITGISCLKVAEIIPSRIQNLGEPLCVP